jgi:hypothetical protein
MSRAGAHIGELALRRHRAGEDVGVDAAAHAAACPECRARLKALDDEQRRFERDISFDRFSAGVERAARGDRARGRRPLRGLQTWMAAPVLAAAAAVALVVTFAPPRHGHNTLKGGAFITVRVRGENGVQRVAASAGAEALARGERVRIGYQRGDHRYLLALSIDDHGEVTSLYPEEGQSLLVNTRCKGCSPAALEYLPDSVEFSDADLVRLVVVLSDQPIEVAAARRAARTAFKRAEGDVLGLGPLDLPGEQFPRTFVLPSLAPAIIP